MMKKMSKQLLVLLCSISLGLLTGCSDDNITTGHDPVTPPEQLKDTATVVDLGNVSLSLSETPFGADTGEGSRVQELQSKIDTIDLCDGVMAEVTLEREKLPATRTIRRILPDGNYHIFVYQGTTWQWMKFTMQSGKMISHTGKIQVEPGVYDIYCCNEAVTFHSTTHQFEVLLKHAGLELFGFRRGVTIGGYQDKVAINLTRLSARVKTRVSAMTDFVPGFATTLLTTANIPGGMVYDTPSGNFIPNIPQPLPERTDSYVAAPDVAPNLPVYQKYGVLKSVVSSDYRYVFMGTSASSFQIKFQGNSLLYNVELFRFGTHPIQTSVGSLANGASYIFHVRLLPHFKYLYQDGTIDYIKNKGNRLPVALVLSDHLGIALHDAAPVDAPNDFTPIYTWPGMDIINPGRWSDTEDAGQRIRTDWAIPARYDNDITFTSWQEAIGYTAKNGQYWTWNPAGTRATKYTSANTIKGNSRNNYPAFWWSDQYRATMLKRCQDAGLTYDNALLGVKGRWFLPSLNDWMWFLEKPGMSTYAKLVEFEKQIKPTDPVMKFANGPYYSQVVRLAFTDAGGTPPFKSATEGYHYWTSSEFYNPAFPITFHLDVRFAFVVTPDPINRFYISPESKRNGPDVTPDVRVRSFVSF